MAGIRVDTPKGTGWEYSLNQVNWQTSRVFMSLTDGSAFITGTTYTVYCRNTSQRLLSINSILFGLPSSNDGLPVTLDLALQGGSSSQIVPFFEGGVSAILPETDETIYPTVVVGPDGTFYLRNDSPTPHPAPLPVFDSFVHFEFVPDEVDTLADSYDQFAHFDLIPDEVEVVTPIPYVVQQVWRGSISFIEGATGTAWLNNLWSDGSETRFTGQGNFSLEIPYPNDITFSVSSDKTLSITIPPDKLDHDVSGRIFFTYANEQVISQAIAYLNTDTVLPNSIQYVQARFVTNYFGSGASNDLLEIQMLDTYPGQPMFISVRLASQAAPGATDGGFQFQRVGASDSVRSYQLASGQNLKNKSFKIYIATNVTQLASQHIHSFSTTSVSSNGFVTL